LLIVDEIMKRDDGSGDSSNIHCEVLVIGFGLEGREEIGVIDIGENIEQLLQVVED
jgi:hypothetical protein